MTILILGASGATGKLLLKQFEKSKYKIKVVVRDKRKLNLDILNNQNIEIIENTILNMNRIKLVKLLEVCDIVVSCLGHNLSFEGIYGKPQKLVTNTIKRICDTHDCLKNKKTLKLILMNTAGNINHDENEKVSIFHNYILSLIRFLVPPHLDNETAANYLREKMKNNSLLQWVVIRPDSLINKEQTSPYSLYISPTRSALLNAGQTSRINVANFMYRLVLNDDLWEEWKGKMPVIYNITN